MEWELESILKKWIGVQGKAQIDSIVVVPSIHG